MQRKLTVSDPEFNLREILKQMTLLEDHLVHPHKVCPDCITKHLLCIEALAEEGVALAPTGKHATLLERLASLARQWHVLFLHGDANLDLAQRVRKIRKALAPSFCSPLATKIAKRYLRIG